MVKDVRLLLVLVTVFAVGPWAAVSADAETADTAKRVTLALRQATLVQSMGGAACFAMAGLDADRNATLALEHADSYNTTLVGLRDGHDWLGLEPVRDPQHLTAIAATQNIWQGFRPAIYQLIAGDMHSAVMRQIMRDTDGTVDASNALATHFLATLDVAGLGAGTQQAAQRAAATRMLTQRALREMCFVLYDLGGTDMRNRFAATLDEIDAAFAMVSNGSGEVAPPPNARVARNLRTAQLFWGKMRPTLDAVLGPSPPDAMAVQKMLKLNRSVIKQLDQAVEGYF